ncbi:MAG: hypothetical protein Q9M36_15890 [Sulfurovum sp.]|nr:hypothetical protein [Sulfurovum sp.]
MRILFIIFSITILFTACTKQPLAYSKEIATEKKIQSNQYRAKEAQNEYKQLQAQREKE